MKQRQEDKERLRANLLKNLDLGAKHGPLSPSQISKSVASASYRSKSISVSGRGPFLEDSGCVKCETCNARLIG